MHFLASSACMYELAILHQWIRESSLVLSIRGLKQLVSFKDCIVLEDSWHQKHSLACLSGLPAQESEHASR